MAKASYVQKGDTIDYMNATETAVEYHDIVVIGSLVGVAQEPITKGNTGSVSIEGVYALPTDAGDIAAGDPVYWDAASGKAVKENSGSLVCAGVAVGASAGGTVNVKLNILTAAASASDGEG